MLFTSLIRDYKGRFSVFMALHYPFLIHGLVLYFRNSKLLRARKDKKNPLIENRVQMKYKNGVVEKQAQV